MAAAGEFGFQEQAHHARRRAAVHHAGAHREHVGIVVLARVAHGGVVVTERAPDAGDLVGGHRRPDPGGIDHDAQRRTARGDLAPDRGGEIRVVHGVGGMRAAVVHRPAHLLGDGALEHVLERDPAVVAADGHAPG